MKNLFTTLFLLCTLFTQVCANNPMRTIPYPQQEHTIYINPAPLLVPKASKQSDFLQFNLSMDKEFKDSRSILSKPVPWCVFNPHQILDSGTWYWRFRSVSKSGEEMPWSPTYSFTVTEDTPQFATPPFSTFFKNIPEEYPRIYCFLKDSLEEARKNVRSHPEFEAMIDEGRNALGMNYTKPVGGINLVHT